MALVSGSVIASAATLTYSGTLPNPNAIFEVKFTLDTQANLTMQTTSVVGGGFDAVLWLFDSTGTTQLAKNDPPANTEAMISEPNFAAGTYLLILSAWDQHYCLANSVCNGVDYGNTGWSYNGLPDFGGRGSNFALTINANEEDTPTENSHAVLDPTQAVPAAVPEPASAAMLMTAGALLLLRRPWLRLRAARAGRRSAWS